MRTRTTTTAALALALGATLSACGGGSTQTETTSAVTSAATSSATSSAAAATSATTTETTSTPATTTATATETTTAASPASTSAAAGSPAALVQEAMDTAKTAKSAHVVASGTSGGQPMKMDLQGPTKGKDVLATVTMNGQTMGVARKGAKTFVRQGASGAWLDASGRDTTSLDGVSVQALFSDFLGGSGDFSEMNNAKVTESTVAGVPVTVLTDPGDAKTSVSVSKTTPRRLMAVSGTQGKDTFSMTFSDWDAVPPIVVPPKN